MSKSKVYTMEEVKKHNTAESLWLVINNNVYDVTAYQEQHPGGPEILLDNSGQNATKAFDEIGHSEDAKEIMKKFIIGTVDTAQAGKSSALNDLVEDIQKNFYRYAAITLGVAVCLGANFLVYKQLSK